MRWFRRTRELEERLQSLWQHHAHLESRVDDLRKRVDSSAPAVLRADLDDVRAAIEIDRTALRKQLGKIWGRIGSDERPDTPSAERADPELQAWIDLQSAK